MTTTGGPAWSDRAADRPVRGDVDRCAGLPAAFEAALAWLAATPEPPSLVGCIEGRMAADQSPLAPLVEVMERRHGSRALKED